MELKLSFEQTKVLSEIFTNLGHIFFASMVIPFLVLPNIPSDFWLMLWGTLLTITSWLVSLAIVKKI